MLPSFKWRVLGLPALLLVGCENTGGVAPPVSAAMVGASRGESAGTLETGRTLFTTRCTACHSAEPIASRSVFEWRHVVAAMAGRSHLDAAQERALMAYISAAHSLPAASSGTQH